MGLFDKWKGKKQTVDWSNAYTAAPKFYGNAFWCDCIDRGNRNGFT